MSWSSAWSGKVQIVSLPTLGGASLEIHQALTRSDLIRNTLCRHEQASAQS